MNLLRQLRIQCILIHAPFPVASQRGGNIDPGTAVQLQVILHGDDGSVRAAGQCRPDDLKAKLFVLPLLVSSLLL